MKYEIVRTARFRKHLRLMLKRGKDLTKLMRVVEILARGETLPANYKDHALIGDLIGLRDCHVENDWVLIYQIKDDVLVLSLTDTGTHSDLGL